MSYRGEVKSLLLRMINEQSSEKELKRLYNITGIIAESYLKTHYPAFLKICLLKGETSSDLAKYSIAEVFQLGNKLEFVQLKEFATSLYVSLENTEKDEVVRAYHAFVQKVALRRLIKTYSDVDSAGAKIYRNIHDCHREKDSFVIEQELWGAVIRPSKASDDKHLPPYPKKELERIYSVKMRDANSVTIPGMMTVLMEILEQQEKYRRSVPVLDVVQLFKRYYSFISTYEVPQLSQPDLSELSKEDLTLLKKYVIGEVGAQIKSTYAATRKISLEEAELLYKTIVEIIDSWFDEEGTERCSYYRHAKKYLGISKSEYQQTWSAKVDYMLREVRNKITVYIVEGPRSSKFLNS